MHEPLNALARTAAIVGNRSAARMAMMAITVSSSMSVKARRARGGRAWASIGSSPTGNTIWQTDNGA
jgi:hypothetical protein